MRVSVAVAVVVVGKEGRRTDRTLAVVAVEEEEEACEAVTVGGAKSLEVGTEEEDLKVAARIGAEVLEEEVERGLVVGVGRLGRVKRRREGRLEAGGSSSAATGRGFERGLEEVREEAVGSRSSALG